MGQVSAATDFGDAPNNDAAYPGVLGIFPSLLASDGGRCLNTGEELIGTTVTDESDAKVVDNDEDDPVYVTVVAVSIPAPAIVKIPVTIPSNAPDVTRYINVLIDFDMDGEWSGDENGQEWAVQNFAVNVAPGTTQWIATPGFTWTKGARLTPAWMRIALTRQPINANDWDGSGEFEFGEIQDHYVTFSDSPPPPPPAGVCGNGVREGAEQCDGGDDKACPGKCKADCSCPVPPVPKCGNDLREGAEQCDGKDAAACPGRCQANCKCPVPPPKNSTCGNNKREGAEQCDGTDDAACKGKCAADCKCPKPPGGGGGEDGFPPPGPLNGPCTTEVNYHAIIVNAGDHSGESIVKEGAADMAGMFNDQGYGLSTVDTIAGLEQAVDDVVAKMKCLDRVFIYIIGHGLEKDSRHWYTNYATKYTNGGITMKKSKEILTPEKLKEILDKIKPCKDEECKQEKVNCFTTVLIESCHSGNFDDLAREGLNLITTSRSTQVSYGGADGSGADYTDGFVKDMKDAANADLPPKDGYVSVEEAHKSAEAKLSSPKGKKQTPRFQGKECPCVCCKDPTECPQTYCGDNKVQQPNDMGVIEACDGADDRCPQGYICSNCQCYLDEGPIDEGPCPEGTYSSPDCDGTCKEYMDCVPQSSAVFSDIARSDCYVCQRKCKSDQFYDDPDCGEGCEEPEECLLVDEDGPCYECAEEELCPGMYVDPECDGDCDEDETCELQGDTGCYDCEEKELTCEERGYYDNPGCDEECEPDEVCDSYQGCYRCEDKPDVCGGDLFDSGDCDGECPGQCEIYGDGPCYYCACPDLYVKSISAHISRSANCPQCVMPNCVTTCTLTASVDWTIANGGYGTAPASTALVEVTPNVGSSTPAIGSLASGASQSGTENYQQQKSYNGVCDTSVCLELNWWVNTYTAKVTADSPNKVSECSESNNVNQVSKSYS